MDPNPYESASAGEIAAQKRGPFWWFALAVSFLVCAVPSGIAVYAWLTHWRWQQTGAYERNSFPMGKFASDATWVAFACVAITLCCWLAWGIMNRKRNS